MSFASFDPEEEFIDITSELWYYVYERDSGLCQICGAAGTEVHHVKYKSRMGKNKANNLILLCQKHHNYNHDTESIDEEYLLNRIKKNERKMRLRLV